MATCSFITNNLFERVLGDMQTFLDSKEKYKERNIHWHRGYAVFWSSRDRQDLHGFGVSQSA